MIVSWALFLLWLILNMLDISISLLAHRLGAVEVGLLYQISGTWSATSVNKIILAMFVGLILVYFRRNGWFSLLNLGMLGICIINGYTLLKLLA